MRNEKERSFCASMLLIQLKGGWDGKCGVGFVGRVGSSGGVANPPKNA